MRSENPRGQAALVPAQPTNSPLRGNDSDNGGALTDSSTESAILGMVVLGEEQGYQDNDAYNEWADKILQQPQEQVAAPD